MTKRYLVVFGLSLELLAALWLIGNPSSPSDAMLALLLHIVAATCFTMGTNARFDRREELSGRFALFTLSLLLPLVGLLVFTILTSDARGTNTVKQIRWREIEPPALDYQTLNKKNLSATALRALVTHSDDTELRLEALHKTIDLGQHAAKPILQAALHDESELVRRTAFDLLEGRHSGVYHELSSLLEVMDKNPDSLNDTQIQAEAASQLWELAYQGLADPEAVDGFLARANAHLHRAMMEGSPDPELYFQRGRIRLKLNETLEARTDFETALALGQCHDEVLPYLAECEFQEGHYERIIEWLQKLTPIRQRSGRFHKILSIWAGAT